jgi:hypothetical protein
MFRWIFGYGSLLIPLGVNGRGMQHQYAENDLFEATLKGYRREWNARLWSLSAQTEPNRYLGLKHDSLSTVNGVVFGINDLYDWESFLRSEASAPNNPKPVYQMVDVTEQIVFPQSSRFNLNCFNLNLRHERVFTCVTTTPSYQGLIPPGYKKLIMRALTVRGPKFEKEFFRTTNFTDLDNL